MIREIALSFKKSFEYETYRVYAYWYLVSDVFL